MTLPLRVDGLGHDLGELVVHLLDGRVHAVAVGRLHEQVVGAVDRRRVAQDGQVLAAEVAREDQAARGAAVGDVEVDLRRAEDVAGLDERGGEAGQGRERLIVGDGDEAAQRLDGVVLVVDRFDRLPVGIVLVLAVEVLGVAHLDARGVAQHVHAEVARGGRAVDAPLEPRLDERRQRARVVDVRVREDDRVGGDGLGRQLGIARPRLVAPPLVHPAVDEHAPGGGLDEVHRAGHFLRGTKEADGRRHALSKVYRRSEIRRFRGWATGQAAEIPGCAEIDEAWMC